MKVKRKGIILAGGCMPSELCELPIGDETQDWPLAKLRATSSADADVYTLEKRVAQLADGIARCLGR